MAKSPIVVAAAAAVLALAAVGCSAESADTRVAPLQADVRRLQEALDSQGKSLAEVQKQNREMQEQLASLATRSKGPVAPGAPRAKPAGEAPAPAGAAEPAPSDDPVVAALESEAGRRSVEAVLRDIQKRDQEESRRRQREQTAKWVKDYVNTTLADQLGLDEHQKEVVADVAVSSMEEARQIGEEMRQGGGGAESWREAQAKFGEIRTKAEDKLKQALTVEQFQKYQEVAGRRFGGMGGFGGGGAGGGFGGGPAGGTGGSPGGAPGGGQGGNPR